MTLIPGYSVRETISTDGELTLQKCIRDKDQLPVLLRSTLSKHPPISIIERLEHEYSLKDDLDSSWALKPMEILKYPDGVTVVYEYFSRIPLETAFKFPMDSLRFLGVAISISSTISNMHRAGIVHKDINPENILIDSNSLSVRISNFSIASLASEYQTTVSSGIIEGTLAYISPEQTGRMNRPLDYLTDMYSLGVTFYRMITGELPFSAKDPLELVYAHIAMNPDSPANINESIPKAISSIILKLMSKAPDDRYQSALGLKHDLEKCRDELKTNGRIDEFPLGELDIPETLQIPQKLYGRESEIKHLRETFEQVVRTGAPVAVMVSGYSGIGKSSLVRELYRPAVSMGGFFVSGKFDQYKRNVPYSTIVQAFQELIQQILTLSQDEIEGWRTRLQFALGANGQLMVEMIPQLELIIGEQPPVVALTPTEAQNRFNYVFRQFIGVFATREHPVVLFLDDLQWADTASLRLMKYVMTDADTRFFILMGTYRENEVGPDHPLMRTIEEIDRGSIKIDVIHLRDISFDALKHFVSDILHSSKAKTEPFVRLIYEKTGGNPFFVVQLLKTISNQGLLWFDREDISWEWDIVRIKAVGFTDNIADLMVTRIEGLPQVTRDILKLTSAFGNYVDSHTISIVNELSEDELARELQISIQEGLMLWSGNNYKFAHDRIQQAAYSLIPPQDRAEIHYRIGRLLLADTSEDMLDERIFDIVNQFNQGLSVITDHAEKSLVANLNLIAGRKAKASTAYASAVEYLGTGIGLLPEDSWDKLYELTYALHLEKSDCEFLNGRFEIAERLFDELLVYARANIDKANVYRKKIFLHAAKGENDKAVADGIECLNLFGINLSAHPSKEQILEEYNRVMRNIGDRSIESLVDLPRMEEPGKIAAISTLADMVPSALFTDENLYCLVGSCMANLSVTHGNADASAYGFITVGSFLGPVLKLYKEAYQFGTLSINLIDKYDTIAYKGKVYSTFGNQISVWNRPVRDAVNYLHTAADVLIKLGDITFACYSGNNLITLRRVNGDPLPDVYQESERQIAYAKKVKFQDIVDIIIGMQRFIKNMRKLTSNFSTFSDDDFDEAEFESYMDTHRMKIATCWYYILKLQARFMSGDYAKAIDAASKAEPLLWTTRPLIHFAEFHYYYALALLASYERADEDRKKDYLAIIKRCRAQYQEWSDNCPENFLHGYLLISAEISRITGSYLEAEHLYDQAIESAKENGFIQNEGISNELAARFHLNRGFKTIAKAYILEARYCYTRWKADGKVQQLDLLYPQLLERAQVSTSVDQGVREGQLDVMTVARASQAISSEIDFHKLLGILMKTVMEQAGAEKGFLLHTQNGGYTVDVGAKVETGEIRISQLNEHVSLSVVPISLLNYVARTKDMVLLDDASSPNPFSEDSYILNNRPKSVLCLPIVRQSELVGMLYLENNLLSGAFTKGRITILELLASQAAISLQNAMEYMKRRQAEESLRELTQNLEKRVQDRTSQLEAAYKELEAFSYSVSHDLRAPLRSIDGFSAALLEDYAEQLDPEAQLYLTRVRASTLRMSQLIEDLLRLSRITRAEITRETVNLSSIAEDNLSNLSKLQPDREVEISIQPDVTATGDPSMLRIVMENLLNNAWKFTGKKPIGRIEFGAKGTDAEDIFYVKDNGAGFDMAYAEKLFVPFQRLHDTDEFPGTGIGLAIVHRIIQKHGGRIWTESEVGKGSTFYFTVS